MSKIGDQLFLHIWKRFSMTTRNDYSFSEAGCCNLVLNHWISQGLLTKPLEVRTQFSISNNQDFASLLFAVDKYLQKLWERTRDVFQLLDELGKFRQVHDLLVRMESLGMKLPSVILRVAIRVISKYDNGLAIETYRLHRLMCDKYGPIKMWFLRIFVTTLIRDPRIRPAQIWALLNIPKYEKTPASQRNVYRACLTQPEIKMINDMAMEFALCQFRTKRVVFRAISNCLYHLRLHKADVSPDIAKAFVHIGITREVQGGQYVGQERLNYIISQIEEIEGEKVAGQVDRIVSDWRSFMTRESAMRESVRKRRRGNILRVGPID